MDVIVVEALIEILLLDRDSRCTYPHMWQCSPPPFIESFMSAREEDQECTGRHE